MPQWWSLDQNKSSERPRLNIKSYSLEPDKIELLRVSDKSCIVCVVTDSYNNNSNCKYFIDCPLRKLMNGDTFKEVYIL